LAAVWEKAAKLAGVSLSKMMDILAGYGVEANLAQEIVNELGRRKEKGCALSQ
jgi:predicted HTH domain antitoxin